jgi:hypothetical protein
MAFSIRRWRPRSGSCWTEEHERIAKTLDNVAGDFRTIAKAAYEAGEHAKGVRNDAKHILFSACARWIRTRRHGAE